MSDNQNTDDASTRIEHLTTEQPNARSAEIDRLTPIEVVRLMNAEDRLVPEAVAREADAIARAIEVITTAFRNRGRLIYIGAGTSGRLGVLDASECPPTFNSPPEMVVGLIAGGDRALRTAAEGAEDHPEAGEADLRRIELTAKDVVVGIATSGRTPYVIGALKYAKNIGAATVGLTCNTNAALKPYADILIAPIVGPEIITGSTRLKAGTATKLVLNMLSTGAMIQTGKTYGNLMVDLRATNTKLKARSRRLVSQITGLNEQQAEQALAACDGELKTAVVMTLRNVDPATARQILAEQNQQLRPAIEGAGPRS